MAFMQSIIGRLSTAGELLSFFLQHKWWWLTPMILVMLIFGILLVIGQSSAIAPFIYTLF